MKTLTTLFALVFALICISASADDAGAVVGMLKTNEHIIVITAGPEGPLYTVKSTVGTVLAEQLSGTQLALQFPRLEDLVNTGMADGAGLNERHLAPKASKLID